MWGKSKCYIFVSFEIDCRSMQQFLGNIEAKLDAKGRVFVPAAYRRSLEKEGDGKPILRLDPVTKCVKLYPSSVWSKLNEEFTSHLNMWNKNDLRLYRQFTAGVEEVDLDASGRVLLQKKHLEAIDVTTDVLFVGVGNYFEVWSKANFETDLLGDEDFSEALQEKMGNIMF